MTPRSTLHTLAALMLGGALLVGCGGGDAEAPPPPVGPAPPSSGVDTTAPTVTIANDVAAATATGPVTFTFVFSEDVGNTFEASDVVVTGGTAGAFVRSSGRQATLVVTPTPGQSGTINVSVAAGSFSDIARNNNTAAAAASKPYSVAPPPPPPPVTGTVLANFDTVSPPFAGFEGGEGSAIEAGPAGGSGNALKVLRSGGQVFALAVVNLPSTVPLATGRLTISARVHSPTAGIPMVLKLEGPGANPSTGDLQANQAVVVGWQTLTWTVPAVNANYNTIVLLPNLGTVDAPPGKAYYFDDIQLLPATGGGTVLANFDTVSPPFAGFEGGEGSAIEAGPAGGSGNALKVLRSGGQVFALAVVNLPSTVPLATGRLTISARVHSPTAGIPMVLKLEGPGANPSTGDLQANETVVVGWQTLTWTVPAVNANYNTIVLLPNLGTVDAPPGKAYYFDDIQLLPAASGSTGTVLANFDSVSPPFAGFEGGEGSAIEAGPAGGSGNALKVLRSGGQVFALAVVNLPSTVPLATGRLTISARVHSPTAGIPMVLKLEGPGANPSTGDLQANQAVVVGWQTLTWTVPAVNANYNTIVLLPNLGTVDAPPGKAYYFDDIQLLPAAGGGGGGPATPVTFSTGFAAGGLTDQGGAYFSYSGSNQDAFNCTGGPAFCGSGSGGSGATSSFFAYYQTPTPATALYNGISVLAPGVTTISATADTAGVQVTNQTTVNFTYNNNPEWQASSNNNFGVLLTLGKFYDLDAGAGVTPCNIKLLAVVTPINGGAASPYAVPLSSFAVIQSCNTSLNTVAAALASSPVSEVAFQAAGGGAALPTVGGKTTGANFTVAVGGVYPTTLALTGGVSFQP